MSFELIHIKFGMHHRNMKYDEWYKYGVAKGNHSQILEH